MGRAKESIAAAARRATRRRASVLILVVAILVLLALAGTAFISTTRTDRHASRLHVHNVHADMAVQSAVNMVVSELTADLFAGSGTQPFGYAKQYREPTIEGGAVVGFEYWDGLGDALIRPRVPVLLDTRPNAPVTSLYPTTPNRMLFPFNLGGINPPVWQGLGSTPDVPLTLQPQWVRAYDVWLWAEGLDRQAAHAAPTARPYLGNPLWPHLQLYAGGRPFDADPSTAEIDPVLAADADGDGISDATLWKLPMGPKDNVTYYAAVRVVDNNSAVNVNTALSRDKDWAGNGEQSVPLPPSYFTGRVGLAEMLRSYEPRTSRLWAVRGEFLSLNRHRLGTAAGMQVAGVRGAMGLYARPFDDDGRSRSDFQFLSVADALERQLGSRIGNPGHSVGEVRYRAFTLSDSMALAYRFCLDPGSTPTMLERVLNESLFEYGRTSGPAGRVPTKPYSPEATAEWIERFRYDQEIPTNRDTFRDLRAVLVARNPVSNHAPVPYAEIDLNGDGDRNDMASTLPGSGELVTGRPELLVAYAQIPLDTTTTKPYVGMEPFNRRVGQASLRPVPRVSINSAPFPELWRGFWSVMTSDGVRGQEVRTWLETSHDDPFVGNRFELEDTEPFANDNFKPVDEHSPNLMFRSSIRSPRLPYCQFKVGAQLVLRAALAAVNAEDLRDADHNVSSRLIELRIFDWDTDKVERVAVRVFGTERQPFITEVYVNTDDRADGDSGTSNSKGYVAVELYNPYDEDIPLCTADGADGWTLGLIERRPRLSGAPAVLKVANLLADGRFKPESPGVPVVVPAKGYLVLENYDPTGVGGESAATFRPRAVQHEASPGEGAPVGTPPDAPAVPPVGLPPTGAVSSATVRTHFVPGLHRVLEEPRNAAVGGELVLLRPRRSDCVRVAASPPGDQYDEVNNLADLVPVDQFDFTGVSLPDPAAAPDDRVYSSVHYVRPNGPGAEWQFVYPGRYDVARSRQRHQGMVQVEFGVNLVPTADPYGVHSELPDNLPRVRLGAADPATHPNRASFPIQLAAPGWPGPNPLRSSGNAYPFGGFARLGDILQVPFIGAYTVYAQASPGGLPTSDLYVMNAVSMDSAFAEDTDATDDPDPAADPRDVREQVGRFCPVHVFAPLPLRRQEQMRVDDHGTGGEYPLPARPAEPRPGEPRLPSIETSSTPAGRFKRLRYRWAMDLFDHFTVHAPHNDFFPNVAPSLYPVTTDPPDPISNSGGTAANSDPSDLAVDRDRRNDYAEDYEPLEGLVNVNTAPWKVMAALPMVLNTDGSVNAVKNAELAKAIVYFRDVDSGRRRFLGDRVPTPHGPFKSLFELNEVVDSRPGPLRNPAGAPPAGVEPGFRNGYGTIDLVGDADPDVRAGDTSPGLLRRTETGVVPVTDGVRGDFEEQFLVLNRISNLITTRSDSFTCYVYVMGVEHDGTPQAALKVQRRVAFIADRSAVRPSRPVVRTQFFSNE